MTVEERIRPAAAWRLEWRVPVAAMVAAMGGNVRVGLDDGHAQQVRHVRQIIEGRGLDVATLAEAREMRCSRAAISGV